MATLTPQQMKHLSELMDIRFAREIEEIRAVRARTRDERDAGLPADWIDAALVDATLGRGHVVLYGFRPQYRGQSMATYPLIWSALAR